MREKREKNGEKQYTYSHCIASDRSTPDLERTAQRFLSLPSSPPASRDKLGLRDLLEVYTAALTLGEHKRAWEQKGQGATMGIR
jgi:hypothetical protein